MVPLVRYRFSVDDYHRLGEIGVLGEDDRVELWDGEILVMSPIGSPHAACVSRFNRVLTMLAGDRAIVRVQDPVELNKWSEPQPDLLVVRFRADFYAGAHPLPSDVLLLVEVADTTLPYDRDFKLPRYAADGIVEVWLADLQADTITVYREPGPSGYGSATTARRGDVISPAALPDVTVAVIDVLP
jgi:Uma2 family endonuclease